MTTTEQALYSYKNNRGATYYLHKRVANLRSGRQQTVYFFSRDQREGLLNAIPEGWEAIENEKSGLPFLRKQQQPAIA